MFTIRDVKASEYKTPFFALNHAEANRSFVRIALDPQTMVNQFPEDFELFYLGMYDTETARVKMLEHPEFIMSAIQAIGQKQSAQQTNNQLINQAKKESLE